MINPKAFIFRRFECNRKSRNVRLSKVQKIIDSFMNEGDGSSQVFVQQTRVHFNRFTLENYFLFTFNSYFPFNIFYAYASQIILYRRECTPFFLLLSILFFQKNKHQKCSHLEVDGEEGSACVHRLFSLGKQQIACWTGSNDAYGLKWMLNLERRQLGVSMCAYIVQ